MVQVRVAQVERGAPGGAGRGPARRRAGSRRSAGTSSSTSRTSSRRRSARWRCWPRPCRTPRTTPRPCAGSRAGCRREATRLSALVHEIIELSRLQVAGALGQVGLVDVDTVLVGGRRPRAHRPRRPSTSGSTSAGCAARRCSASTTCWSRRCATCWTTRSRTRARRRTSASGSGSHERPRRDRGGRRGHRHHRGRAGARVRAVLPGRPGALARHRRHRPRPVHRQARRGGPRRRRDRVVAARPRLDVHPAPARAPSGPEPRLHRLAPRSPDHRARPEGAHVRRSAS